MTDAPEIPRDEEMLGQLAEMDLALAKEVFARAKAAQEADELATLSRTYQRLARSCRQSIALLQKIRAERARELRANPPPPPPRDNVRIQRRKTELLDAVERVIWNEIEDEEDRALMLEMADGVIRAKRQPDDWGLEPLDDQVADLCAAWNLPPDLVARWRELPHPDEARDEDDVQPGDVGPELRASG